jgi:hypothetical protein
MKLKGHHINTIEVTVAEPQTVLNILREHNFQDAFKNGRSAVNIHVHVHSAYMRTYACEEGDYFVGDGSPENYGSLFVLLSETPLS